MRRKTKTTDGRARVSRRATLLAAPSELAEVQRASRGGWTPELAGRALAALRIAGTYAIGKTVGQRPSAPATRRRWRAGCRRPLRPRARLVSGAVTTETVASRTARRMDWPTPSSADGALWPQRVRRERRRGGRNRDSHHEAAASAHSLVSEWAATSREVDGRTSGRSLGLGPEGLKWTCRDERNAIDSRSRGT